jgi:hypothetical protein
MQISLIIIKVVDKLALEAQLYRMKRIIMKINSKIILPQTIQDYVSRI